jgi:hypothetical protein
LATYALGVMGNIFVVSVLLLHFDFVDDVEQRAPCQTTSIVSFGKSIMKQIQDYNSPQPPIQTATRTTKSKQQTQQ